MGKTQTRYNAEIVAGALIPNESRIIAQLILDGASEKQLMSLGETIVPVANLAEGI